MNTFTKEERSIKRIKSGGILKSQTPLERREQADPAQFTFSSARALSPLSRSSLSPSKYPSNDIYSAAESDCNAWRKTWLRANTFKIFLRIFTFVQQLLIVTRKVERSRSFESRFQLKKTFVNVIIN